MTDGKAVTNMRLVPFPAQISKPVSPFAGLTGLGGIITRQFRRSGRSGEVELVSPGIYRPAEGLDTNVLLFHPDPAFASAVIPYLVKRGFTVAYASTPDEATRMWRVTYTDVILSEVQPTAVPFLRNVARAYGTSQGTNPVIGILSSPDYDTIGIPKVVADTGVRIHPVLNQDAITASGRSSSRSLDRLVRAIANSVEEKATSQAHLTSALVENLRRWNATAEGNLDLPSGISDLVDYVAATVRQPFKAIGGHLHPGISFLIEGARSGILGMASGVQRYLSTRPDHEVEVYHLKRVSLEALMEEVAQFSVYRAGEETDFPTIRIPTIVGYTKNGTVAFRTVVAANQAHVLNTLGREHPAYSSVLTAFLERDLQMFREWYDAPMNQVVNPSTIEASIEDYRGRISQSWTALAKDSGLAPREFATTISAYQQLISLLGEGRTKYWGTMTDAKYWGVIVDAQPQNIGGLWGTLLPTADGIIRDILTDEGGVRKGELEYIAVFDPQRRVGSKSEDLVHLLDSYEFSMPEADRVSWYGTYLRGLLGDDEKTLSTGLMKQLIVATYKGARKPYVVGLYVDNARHAFETCRINENEYVGLLRNYSAMFEHWREVGIRYSIATLNMARYVASHPAHRFTDLLTALQNEFSGTGIDYSGQHMPRDRVLTTLEAVAETSENLRRIVNPADAALKAYEHANKSLSPAVKMG